MFAVDYYPSLKNSLRILFPAWSGFPSLAYFSIPKAVIAFRLHHHACCPVVHCGRLGGQREGGDLAGQMGGFVGEAPVAKLREKLGYGPAFLGQGAVPDDSPESPLTIGFGFRDIGAEVYAHDPPAVEIPVDPGANERLARGPAGR